MKTNAQPRSGSARLDLALVVLTLLAYLPALRAGFIWDDQMFVTDNKTYQSVSGLWTIWFEPRANPHYYPLLLTAFWAMYRLWGVQPFAYHLVTLLFHIGGALLLRRLLTRLRAPGAVFAAFVFALHPLYVSSVAWVTELKNTMSGFFYLAALWAWFGEEEGPGFRDRGRRTEIGGSGSKVQISNFQFPVSPFHLLSLFLFACALLSKTTTASFLLAVPLVDWWRSGRVGRTTWLRLLPPLALALGLGLLTLWVEQLRNTAPSVALLPWGERWLVAGRSLWFYLGKYFWPAGQTMIYPKWEPGATGWLSLLAAATGLLLLWRLRPRLGRGPLACAVFFVATLFPIPFMDIGFVLQQSFVADHFFYLPGLGLTVAVSAGAAALGRRLPRPGAAAAAAALMLLLAAMTWRHARTFHDQVTLWRDNLAKYPGVWVVRVNLGIALAQQGQDAEARELFREVIRVAPHDPRARWNLADSCRRHGQLAEAEAHYREVLKLVPGDGETLMYLGEIQSAQQRHEEAAESYAGAARAWPWSSVARHRRAEALLRLGRREEARAEFEEALKREPDNPDLMNDIAWKLATHPDGRFRDGPRALQLADRACKRTRYAHAPYMDTLAAACAEVGRFPEARQIAQRAMDMATDPSLAASIRRRLAEYQQARPYVDEPR